MSRRALVLAAAAGVLAAAWFLFFRNPDFVRGKVAGIASFVSAERIEAQARALSEKPHRAGTPANEQVAAALVARLEKAGLKVTASQHKVDLWELTKRRLSRNGRVRGGTIAKGLGHVRGLDHGRLL